MHSCRALISGEWRELSGKLFSSLNPATEEAVSENHSATPDEVQLAVDSARKAWAGWSKRPVEDRMEVMQRVSRLLSERMDDLAGVITLENGKPLVESNMEVMGAQMYADYYASETKQLLQEDVRIVDFPQEGNYEFRTVFEPLGVVAVIAPWNWPLLIPFQGILPALAAGDTVVFKSSRLTPMVGEKLVELLVAAGVPEGVVNFLPGTSEVGERLVASKVDAVIFTGSTKVGQEVAGNAGGSLKRCVLELGGSDPSIIFGDAELEEAVNGVVYGRFFSCGQMCVSVKRILVEKPVLEDFLRLFVEKVSALKVGNGLEAATDVGPLISKAQREGVLGAVEDAASKGAKIHAGGSVPKEFEKGFFYQPTVMTGLTPEMQVLREEVFGPVAPVVSFEGEEEAVRIANSSRYGLGASVWTGSSERALRVARAIESGMVWINDVAITFPYAPWGGVKDSGMGRHSSRYGLLELVNIRQVCINRKRDPSRMWWLPYAKN